MGLDFQKLGHNKYIIIKQKKPKLEIWGKAQRESAWRRKSDCRKIYRDSFFCKVMWP